MALIVAVAAQERRTGTAQRQAPAVHCDAPAAHSGRRYLANEIFFGVLACKRSLIVGSLLESLRRDVAPGLLNGKLQLSTVTREPLETVRNLPVEQTATGFSLGIFCCEDLEHAALPPMTAMHTCIFCAVMLRGYAARPNALKLCQVRLKLLTLLTSSAI